MDKDVSYHRGRKMIMKTNSMGVIFSASGQAAEKIQAQIKNADANQAVLKKSAHLAASITVRRKDGK